MPFIGLAIPGGEWRTAHYTLSSTMKDGKLVENNVKLTVSSLAPLSIS